MTSIYEIVSKSATRTIFALAFGLILHAAALSIACVGSWTREFISPERGDSPTVDGWTFEPDIYAYRDVEGISRRPDREGFFFNIDIVYKGGNKKGPVSPVTYLTLSDSLWIVFEPGGERHFLKHSMDRCVTAPGDDDIRRTFRFQRRDAYDPRIPDSVDTIDVQFDALVGPGRYVARTDKPHRLIGCIAPTCPESDLRRVPVSLRLVRHEESSKIPRVLLWLGS